MARGSPLPLSRDGSGRFLPWLVALMVFLAALALASAALIDSALERWNSGLRGTVTIELPTAAETTAADAAPDSTPASDKLQSALEIVRGTPGVTEARPLGEQDMARLLKPWLGGIEPGILPLPVLVDLKVNADRFQSAPLEAKLRAVYPGASVIQRAQWLEGFLRAAWLVELASGIVVLLIGTVSALAVVFTTRTGLALHAALINLLHLMGASDSYIAQQFQRHAFSLAVRGGLIGLVMTLMTLGVFRLAVETSGGAAQTFDHFALGAAPLAAACAIILLPLIMGLIAWLTARVTVLRTLGRLP